MSEAQVDAAMIQHLTEEVARLERENADLRVMLSRPVNVTVSPISPTMVHNNSQQQSNQQQIVTAIQSVNGAIYNLSREVQKLNTTVEIQKLS